MRSFQLHRKNFASGILGEINGLNLQIAKYRIFSFINSHFVCFLRLESRLIHILYKLLCWILSDDLLLTIICFFLLGVFLWIDRWIVWWRSRHPYPTLLINSRRSISLLYYLLYFRWLITFIFLFKFAKEWFRHRFNCCLFFSAFTYLRLFEGLFLLFGRFFVENWDR